MNPSNNSFKKLQTTPVKVTFVVEPFGKALTITHPVLFPGPRGAKGLGRPLNTLQCYSVVTERVMSMDSKLD